MAYSYFQRLTRTQQKIYLASDKIQQVTFADIHSLQVRTRDLQQVLSGADPDVIEQHCQWLVDGFCEQLQFATARTHVLERRPHNHYGELHGLYEPIDKARKVGQIYVWMRTAKRQQVVAFKTFLRTLIHEFCHHLDFEYFRLADSFHTQGFYQRESSIYKQLLS